MTERRSNMGEEPVPGRLFGVSMMTLLIALVFFWLNREAPPPSLADEAPPLPVEGFGSQTWFLPDTDLLGFVEVPAGPFVMGSDPAQDPMAYANERWSGQQRQGTVELPVYYISRFETTVAQYRAYLIATDRQSEASRLTAGGDFPLTGISWPEALAYTRWLDQQLRTSQLTPAPLRRFLADGARVTLPSEAEWEKAARGDDGRIWPWGFQPASGFAHFNGNQPQAVGAMSCPQCSYGLADMAGNVWELTRSLLLDYPWGQADESERLDQSPLWVMRGGGYADTLANVRAAVRGGADPGVRNAAIGFRVVISTL